MKKEIENNKWKQAEDDILAAGVGKYGPNMWQKICTLLPGRSALECKERYFAYIDSSKMRPWSEDDDQRLIEISCTLRPQWSLIGQYLNRAPQECYERYYKIVYHDIDAYKHPEQSGPVQTALENDCVEMAYDRINSFKNRKKR